MVKIGITDLGEPCFDTSWIDKTSSIDGLVLVSKGHLELFHNKLLELKDKVKSDEISFFKAEPSSDNGEIDNSKKEAIEALTALGYSASDALKAVNKVEDAASLDSEALLKAALKNMF